MPRKLKLNIEYVPEFSIIGIVSAQKDYRLSWLLNKYLDADLKKLQDFIFRSDKSKNPGRYAAYHHELPDLMAQYFLVSNKSNELHLLKEPKNLDYLFLLKNPGQHIKAADIVGKIRSVPPVEAAFIIDQPGAASNTMLYDFELHLGKTLI